MISRNFLNFGTSANIRREICAKWRIWQFFPHDSGVIRGICAETRIISFLWKIRTQFFVSAGETESHTGDTGGQSCPPCMTAAPCRAGPACPAVTGVGIRLSLPPSEREVSARSADGGRDQTYPARRRARCVLSGDDGRAVPPPSSSEMPVVRTSHTSRREREPEDRLRRARQEFHRGRKKDDAFRILRIVRGRRGKGVGMMRGLSSALKKIVRGERKAGAHSRFSPGCRREAERTEPPGCKVFIARHPMHIPHTAASPVPRSTAPRRGG